MSYYLKDSVVVPGQIVAQQEEFVEGEGTYIDFLTGFIRSSLVGKISIDFNNKIININPKKKIKLPKKGSIVVGSVSTVRENIIFVDIYGSLILYPRPQWEAEFSGPLSGSILSNQAGLEKNNDLQEIVKPNDIILAKVTNQTNPYNLTLKGPQLGVIYSTCSKCGSIMLPGENNTMKCPRCGNVEKRKISNLASSRLLRIELKRTLLMPP
ncbi:MAG: exosome complex RNA-binding protein Csl4 [Caldisphaera sp.]|jgi:exosome complex component CSL4|nr:exosome complex RNA-binding protein Csl4 [Caldisphaera sp.]PMP61168.1 MAG: RNA-binding protein [Caldisphaera sp.]PMP90839.1 MAG: RNA-binding protein [Caldisphaera sp.]